MQPNDPGAGLSFSINDQMRPLAMLLFVRQAWGLAGDLDLPPLDPMPDPGASAPPPGAEASVWNERWDRLWLEAWEVEASGEFVVPGRPAQRHPGRGPEMEDGQPAPGCWANAYGEDGIDMQRFQAWDRELDRLRGAFLGTSFREPRFMQAVAGGLSEFILLPCAGYYLHRLGAHQVVLSWQTMADPGLRRRAIDEWLRGDGRPDPDGVLQ